MGGSGYLGGEGHDQSYLLHINRRRQIFDEIDALAGVRVQIRHHPGLEVVRYRQPPLADGLDEICSRNSARPLPVELPEGHTVEPGIGPVGAAQVGKHKKPDAFQGGVSGWRGFVVLEEVRRSSRGRLLLCLRGRAAGYDGLLCFTRAPAGYDVLGSRLSTDNNLYNKHVVKHILVHNR